MKKINKKAWSATRLLAATGGDFTAANTGIAPLTCWLSCSGLECGKRCPGGSRRTFATSTRLRHRTPEIITGQAAQFTDIAVKPRTSGHASQRNETPNAFISGESWHAALLL